MGHTVHHSFHSSRVGAACCGALRNTAASSQPCSCRNSLSCTLTDCVTIARSTLTLNTSPRHRGTAAMGCCYVVLTSGGMFPVGFCSLLDATWSSDIWSSPARQHSETVHTRISRESSPEGRRTRFKCDREAGSGNRLLTVEIMDEACCGQALTARKSTQDKPTSESSDRWGS